MPAAHKSMSEGDMNQFKIAGLGEVLWDAFPDGEKFGGAPANFTCHCGMLGATAYVVSAIGNDMRGELAAEFLNQQGVNTSGLAVLDDHETGVVIVTLDANGQPSYEIKEGVAWDHIPWSDTLEGIAQSLDAVCFGSLCQRDPNSRETITRFLSATPRGCLRVFDINLRQSFYNDDVIRESLERADVLKLNDDELPVVASLYEIEGSDEETLKALLKLCGLKLAALTRGERGSLMVMPDAVSDLPGIEVDIVDTVGAGDAFTAAMITGHLNGASLADINTSANRVAASVCSHPGAVPKTIDELRRN
jgi:fructokinase